MAITFDDWWETIRTGTGDPMTWLHTPGAPPQAITVAVLHGASDTEHVASVTYGAVPLIPIISAVDSANEPGRCSLFFLGTGVPTGAQTVSVDLTSGTTDDIFGVSVSWFASGDCEVIDSDKVDGDTLNPSVTLTAGGRHNAVFGGIYAGGDSSGTTVAGAGVTEITAADLGAWVAKAARRTTPGTTDFTFAYTAALDDVAMAALMFAEAAAPSTDSGPGFIGGGFWG